MKARVGSLDWPVNIISIKRMILAMTAISPAPRMAIALIIFLEDICRVLFNGKGRRRMGSLTQQMTVSARIVDASSKHVLQHWRPKIENN
jgi:hypothetical protein